ncbi:MAG: hypothetical protein ACRECC_11840 [Pseudolabrys sp.]
MTVAADPYAALARQTEPAEPTEAEYQAFCDALMDDERGRWFLAEFTRRNRNADTGLLLKALDRIEALVQLGSPDVFARLHQELRAILETIRASRAEAATDEFGETARLLVLLAQIERRIDAMIGEPPRAAAPAVVDEPQPDMHGPLAVAALPETAAETPAPAETATMMPPVAWTEPAATMPEAIVTPDAIATSEPPSESALADIQPAPPGNENEPQATYVTEPVTQAPITDAPVTAAQIERAIAEWMAASTEPAPVPAPMAFGEIRDISPEIDSAAGGFALPDATALTEPEPQEWTPAPAAEPALVETPEPVKTQAIVLEQFETAVETQIEEPQPQAAAPEGPHVLPAAAERTFAPYEFEVLTQPAPESAPAEIVTAQAMPTEVSAAETGTVEVSAAETGATETTGIDTSVIETGAIETSAAEPVAAATAETLAETATEIPAVPPALDTLESRMAAANALAALAGLSEEERIALFT